MMQSLGICVGSKLYKDASHMIEQISKDWRTGGQFYAPACYVPGHVVIPNIGHTTHDTRPNSSTVTG